MTTRLFRSALVAVSVIAASGAAIAQTVISDGHIDLIPGYDAGTQTWSLTSQYSGGVLAPSGHLDQDVADVIYYVGDAGIMTSPGAPFGTAGQDIWIIPQIQNFEVPWLGTGGYDASGLNFTMNLVDFRGPADAFVGLWTSGSFGGFNWLGSSDTGAVPAANVLNVVSGSHTHYNWAFTEAGLYEIDVSIGATIGGVPQTSELFTLTIAVGDYPSVIPEPSAFATLAGFGALGVATLRRRRRQNA